jgi:hypothetical protein
MSENMGASTSRNPMGFHSLYRDNFTFTFSWYWLRPHEPGKLSLAMDWMIGLQFPALLSRTRFLIFAATRLAPSLLPQPVPALLLCEPSDWA